MSKKEAIKAKRLEKLITDFTKWLDINSGKVTVEEIKVYWKRLIEDYVFEYIDKVINILNEIEGGKSIRKMKQKRY